MISPQGLGEYINLPSSGFAVLPPPWGLELAGPCSRALEDEFVEKEVPAISQDVFLKMRLVFKLKHCQVSAHELVLLHQH